MGLISTNKASCRDCYKCVRHCPVKAIRVTAGHAEVVENRCLGDGRCVAVCPQKAKKVTSGLAAVREFINSGYPVAVSLAPSFVAAFPTVHPLKLVSALRLLGFRNITETAEGAEYVAEAHKAAMNRSNEPVITSCCPVIVNLIEIYYPELHRYLARIVSPMVAHGRILKKRYGSGTKVVFIGPCIAKKGEVGHDEAWQDIDQVLTFQELNDMLNQAGIILSTLEPGSFDGQTGFNSEAFPAPGGLARAAALSTDLLAREVISIDGMEESMAFLERFDEAKDSLRLVELLACRGGCLVGPCMNEDLSPITRREALLKYVVGPKSTSFPKEVLTPDLNPRQLKPVFNAVGETVAEEDIRAVLARTGKNRPEDELNCGACGYDTCREKAKAVIVGMAEVDMCIPFMRAKAESRAHLICEMTPNAIFVVDRDLKILELNPAAERLFRCSPENVIGGKLEAVINPQSFEEALRTKEMIMGEVTYPNYGLVAWQIVFHVENDDVVIGIFLDITAEQKQKEQLTNVTAETLEKAQEVINKQMRVAQEIAGLLGETTAETKVLLTKLMSLFQKQ